MVNTMKERFGEDHFVAVQDGTVENRTETKGTVEIIACVSRDEDLDF